MRKKTSASSAFPDFCAFAIVVVQKRRQVAAVQIPKRLIMNSAVVPAWLQAIYPFTPKSFISPAGARMSFLDEGPSSNVAVLMLHGNPTWSFYFRDLVRARSPA